MLYVECDHCGAGFYREYTERWKRLCLSCWKASKRLRTDEAAELREELLELRQELAYYRARAEQIPDKHDLEQALAEKLQRLIFFCHPDKHGNAQEATELTQWLLSLRELFR